jgi:hypothetical protein
MSLATLLEWWNFIFALPLAVGGVLLLGLALSGMIDLSGDQADSDAHHADAHADHATDFHGDAGDAHDAGVDAHADHAGEFHGDAGDAHHADSSEHGVVKTPYASHDDHAAAEKPLWLKVLNLFGIGMGLPISMALPLLMMVWGAVGLIANRLLEPLLQLPALFAPLSMGVALADDGVRRAHGRSHHSARAARRGTPDCRQVRSCRQHGARGVRNHALKAVSPMCATATVTCTESCAAPHQASRTSPPTRPSSSPATTSRPTSTGWSATRSNCQTTRMGYTLQCNHTHNTSGDRP